MPPVRAPALPYESQAELGVPCLLRGRFYPGRHPWDASWACANDIHILQGLDSFLAWGDGRRASIRITIPSKGWVPGRR